MTNKEIYERAKLSVVDFNCSGIYTDALNSSGPQTGPLGTIVLGGQFTPPSSLRGLRDP